MSKAPIFCKCNVSDCDCALEKILRQGEVIDNLNELIEHKEDVIVRLQGEVKELRENKELA